MNQSQKRPKDKFLFIIGMHRSGTSCLAGSLESCGLFLGEVNKEASFNKKGNRENQEIVSLHESLLINAGFSWQSPPPPIHETSSLWSEQAIRDQRRIFLSLRANAEGRPMGIKDPRALFFLSGWDFFEPSFIATYRHPISVAESIVRRAKAWREPMNMDKALNLWRLYNVRLLNHFETCAFPAIRYDQSEMGYSRDLEDFSKYFGLPMWRNASSFRTEALINHNASAEKIPSDLKEVWKRLEELPKPSEFL